MDIWTVNVGGETFQTTASTLRRANYFRNLMGDYVPLYPRPPLFVDRDPRVFQDVLNVMRGTATPNFGAMTEDRIRFKNELAFYGVNDPNNETSAPGTIEVVKKATLALNVEKTDEQKHFEPKAFLQTQVLKPVRNSPLRTEFTVPPKCGYIRRIWLQFRLCNNQTGRSLPLNFLFNDFFEKMLQRVTRVSNNLVQDEITGTALRDLEILKGNPQDFFPKSRAERVIHLSEDILLELPLLRDRCRRLKKLALRPIDVDPVWNTIASSTTFVVHWNPLPEVAFVCDPVLRIEYAVPLAQDQKARGAEPMCLKFPVKQWQSFKLECKKRAAGGWEVDLPLEHRVRKLIWNIRVGMDVAIVKNVNLIARDPKGDECAPHILFDLTEVQLAHHMAGRGYKPSQDGVYAYDFGGFGIACQRLNLCMMFELHSMNDAKAQSVQIELHAVNENNLLISGGFSQVEFK